MKVLLPIAILITSIATAQEPAPQPAGSELTKKSVGDFITYVESKYEFAVSHVEATWENIESTQEQALLVHAENYEDLNDIKKGVANGIIAEALQAKLSCLEEKLSFHSLEIDSDRSHADFMVKSAREMWNDLPRSPEHHELAAANMLAIFADTGVRAYKKSVANWVSGKAADASAKWNALILFYQGGSVFPK